MDLRARRLTELPPYLFAELDRKKARLQARGVDVVDLGIGDPDLPTPARIVEAARRALGNPAHHRYPDPRGYPPFREAVARFYEERFGVALDPDHEVIPLIGSKEGIAHFSLAFLDPGDLSLVPDPSYPVYRIGAGFAGAEALSMPLRKEKAFLPDLDAIPAEALERAKVIFLNYPNNPTSATASAEFFERVVALARKHSIIVCHDAAYTEIYLDDERPPSFLATPGAKEVGIEFHSLSKSYNMTGWRIGFAVGNREIIEGLLQFKNNVDSGLFHAFQEAAVTALTLPEEEMETLRGVYRRRRDRFVAGLSEIGITLTPPSATFYLWAEVPGSRSSTDFARQLLDDLGVVVTPGVGFGAHGEGFFRMVLSLPDERIEEALTRLKKLRL